MDCISKVGRTFSIKVFRLQILNGIAKCLAFALHTESCHYYLFELIGAVLHLDNHTVNSIEGLGFHTYVGNCNLLHIVGKDDGKVSIKVGGTSVASSYRQDGGAD